MALDAGTHLEVGWAGIKGDMGVGVEKKDMGYVITSEKSGTGIKDWCGHQFLGIWIVVVWLSLRKH